MDFIESVMPIHVRLEPRRLLEEEEVEVRQLSALVVPNPVLVVPPCALPILRFWTRPIFMQQDLLVEQRVQRVENLEIMYA